MIGEFRYFNEMKMTIDFIHRHLYALLRMTDIENEENEKANGTSVSNGASKPPSIRPSLFSDPGYALGTTDIISTSNCGNPALRLFGFASTSARGFGIGYIIRDTSVSLCISSKHRQTGRFIETIQAYLVEVEQMLIQLHKEANKRNNFEDDQDDGGAYSEFFNIKTSIFLFINLSISFRI